MYADYATDTETGESVEVMTLDAGTALEAVNRAEVDVQIATARRFPRSIRAFKQQALELATLDEETAASMFYALPRGGKKIEGPSVRMAEVIASTWGNLRVEARVAAIDDRYVTAVGTCMDLEKNYAARSEVKRRITNRAGRRFDDDMIQVTCNAACSIAMREAVFKVVPRALFKDIYEQAKLCSVGKALSIQEKRHNALAWFGKAGVPQDRVLGYLGRAGVEEITVDDLITLVGIRTAIKDGEISIEAAFAAPGEDRSVAAASVSERLRQAAAPEPASSAGAPPKKGENRLDRARGAYFTAWKETFPDSGDRDRHAWQARTIGRESTTEWDAADFDLAITRLAAVRETLRVAEIGEEGPQ